MCEEEPTWFLPVPPPRVPQFPPPQPRTPKAARSPAVVLRPRRAPLFAQPRRMLPLAWTLKLILGRKRRILLRKRPNRPRWIRTGCRRDNGGQWGGGEGDSAPTTPYPGPHAWDPAPWNLHPGVCTWVPTPGIPPRTPCRTPHPASRTPSGSTPRTPRPEPHPGPRTHYPIPRILP